MAKRTDSRQDSWSEAKALASLHEVAKPWIATAKWADSPKRWPVAPASSKKSVPLVQFIVDFSANSTALSSLVPKDMPAWLKEQLKKGGEQQVAGPLGPVWWCSRPKLDSDVEFASEARLTESAYTRSRDWIGSLYRLGLEAQPQAIAFHFLNDGPDDLLGALVGLEMAAYRFKDFTHSSPARLSLFLSSSRTSAERKKISAEAGAIASGVNLARHLVNLPPHVLVPKTYAQFLVAHFSKQPHVQVDVWEKARLKREQMNLLLAVGQGSEHEPCLVHIRLRPKTSKKASGPVALVGKGVTFDTGGLDIKPSSGMRLMKKDMGDSAAVVGFCHYLVQSRLERPYDFYLSLAENAVSGRAFAPSDVIRSRNGRTIEIHNTDAEGRLVMADALALAVEKTGRDRPAMVLDVATLTGAIKVGLGAEVGGLFSSQQDLATQVEQTAAKWGDYLWHMPLIQSYRRSMTSRFADMTNAVDGYGGAITAALFLQSFVGQVPWAHMDIYGWRDSVTGAWSEVGGSGQGVQALVGFAKSL